VRSPYGFNVSGTLFSPQVLAQLAALVSSRRLRASALKIAFVAIHEMCFTEYFLSRDFRWVGVCPLRHSRARAALSPNQVAVIAKESTPKWVGLM
jgi:hypothetical protein